MWGGRPGPESPDMAGNRFSGKSNFARRRCAGRFVHNKCYDLSGKPSKAPVAALATNVATSAALHSRLICR